MTFKRGYRIRNIFQEFILKETTEAFYVMLETVILNSGKSEGKCGHITDAFFFPLQQFFSEDRI